MGETWLRKKEERPATGTPGSVEAVESDSVLGKLRVPARSLKSASPTEQLAATLKVMLTAAAGIAGHPALGALASLIGDWIPQVRARRFQDFIEAVAADLVKIGGHLDEQVLRRDEAAGFVERVILSACRQRDEEKWRCYRTILVREMLEPSNSTELRDFYMSILDGLSSMEVRLLRCFHDPAGYARARGITGVDQGGIGSLLVPLQRCFPEVEEDDLRAAITSLDAKGLLKGVAGGLSTTMSSTAVKQIEGRMTGFGRRMVEFISKTPSAG